MGMGVFSGIFSIAAPLISTVCLAVAVMPVLFRKKKCYWTDSNNSSLLIPEFG